MSAPVSSNAADGFATPQTPNAGAELAEALERERAAHARLVNILESMGDAFVALDTEWRYTYMNQKAGQIFDRPPEAMLGKHIWTEFPEGIGQPFYQAYYKAVETQQPIFLEEYYPPYNRWFENRIYPSPDGLAIFFQDITDRKRAEEALRQSEERLTRIVETVPEGIAIVNRNGQITFANAAAESILGLTRGDITDRAYNDLGWRITAVDGSPYPEAELPFAKVMRTGEAVHGVEHAIEHPDGQRVILSINAAPLREQDGVLGGMVAVISDSTERKRAEETLRESEERYRLLVEKSPYAIGVHQDGNIVFANPAAAHLFGASTEAELLGKPIQQLVAPETWGAARERIGRMLQGETGLYPTEDRYRQVDGTVVPVEVTAAPFIYHGRPAIQVIALDITQRQRAEEELRVSEERFSRAFFVSPAGMTITRLADGKFVDANKSFLRLFEFSRDEVIGRTSTELAMWTPEERQRLIRAQIEAGGLQDFELQARAKSGRLIQLLFSSRPMELEGETCLITTMIDITERKRAEDELRRLNTELEQRVAERTAELKEQYVRTATFEERQRLARDLHDVVSQTLFSASVIAETLPRLWTRHPEQVRGGLEELHRLTRGALAEMRALLLELRPEALKEIKLADLLGHLANALAGRTQIEVTLNTEPILTVPIETRLALYRITQEALNNIVKHARAQSVYITLRPSAAGSGVRLSIRDDGQGFAAADVPPGHLGLSIMRERAEAISAIVAIHSQPGAGTEVVVTWPHPLTADR